jgi:rhodanese-related sulfurtransferase
MSRPSPSAPGDGYATLARAARSFIQEIPVDEADRLLRQEAALWVDVREPEELEALAPPAGALNLPLTRLPAAALAAIHDRQRPLIVACGRGDRSALAALQLGEAGYTRVYSLAGGLMAWVLRD